MADDTLVLDRGYPSIGLLYVLQHKGISLCIRLKENWWNEVNDMLEAKEIKKVVTFRLSKKG